MNAAAQRSYVAHLLRVFGVPAVAAHDPPSARASVRVSVGESDPQATPGIDVVIAPTETFCAGLGVTVERAADPGRHDISSATCPRLGRLQSHRPGLRFSGEVGDVIAEDAAGRPAWCDIGRGDRRYLLVGTELAADLCLLRQGDPEAVNQAGDGPQWGFDFERPNYLFDDLLQAEDPTARPADAWCELAARAVTARAPGMRRPVLPGGAKLAVIVTGDDDQAKLECYERQLEQLEGLPVTYFMHPLTKVTKEEARRLYAGRQVELGLHPDALDAPERYRELLAEQARWFEQQYGREARCVRNHGFLNDGYWGHAAAWEACGLEFSSNLPGLDGSVMNGSLLPARLLLDERLTEHWSVLTTFGDGMLFALDMSDAEAADRVEAFASSVIEGEIPGIVVLNLHPENAGRAHRLHGVLHEIHACGALFWTMAECLTWFRERDNPPQPGRGSIRRWIDRLFSRRPATALGSVG